MTRRETVLTLGRESQHAQLDRGHVPKGLVDGERARVIDAIRVL
jgi:hypothetical protein